MIQIYFDKYYNYLEKILFPLNKKVRIYNVEKLNAHALSDGTNIFIGPSFYKQNKYIQHITLAHEIAHLWWTPVFSTTLYNPDSFSEFYAYQCIIKFHDSTFSKKIITNARGRLLPLLLEKEKNSYVNDCKFLGRDFLAIACWASNYKGVSLKILKEICYSITNNQTLNLSKAKQEIYLDIECWLKSDYLPILTIQDSWLISKNDTYLPSLLCLKKNNVEESIWYTKAIKIEENCHISSAQISPYFCGNLYAAYTTLDKDYII